MNYLIEKKTMALHLYELPVKEGITMSYVLFVLMVLILIKKMMKDGLHCTGLVIAVMER